tara:strand:- start:114 stop:557 length:444 start_codon:yes stop_codon:yes gene_type:complete
MVKNQIQSFRHAGIVVSNIKKTSDIFKNYLGLKLLMKEKIVKGKYISNLVGINNAKIKITIFISIDNIKYELLEYFNKKNSNKLLQSNNIGLSHLSLTVKNIDKLYNMRKNYNVKFVNSPIINKIDNVKVSYVKIMNEFILELVEEL